MRTAVDFFAVFAGVLYSLREKKDPVKNVV
jgi:hypothetical protein